MRDIDVKSQRIAIVTKLMQFNDEEAAAFWPIFKQYDAGLAKIVNLIMHYAKNYEHLTNEKADEVVRNAFVLEAKRALLKKKYFNKMKAAISAVQAAKFFQIENHIQRLIDLRISRSQFKRYQVEFSALRKENEMRNSRIPRHERLGMALLLYAATAPLGLAQQDTVTVPAWTQIVARMMETVGCSKRRGSGLEARL